MGASDQNVSNIDSDDGCSSFYSDEAVNGKLEASSNDFGGQTLGFSEPFENDLSEFVRSSPTYAANVTRTPDQMAQIAPNDTSGPMIRAQPSSAENGRHLAQAVGRIQTEQIQYKMKAVSCIKQGVASTSIQYDANQAVRNEPRTDVTNGSAQLYEAEADRRRVPPAGDNRAYSLSSQNGRMESQHLEVAPRQPQARHVNGGAHRPSTPRPQVAAYSQDGWPMSIRAAIPSQRSVASSNWMPSSNECSIPGCAARRGVGIKLFTMPKIYKFLRHEASMDRNAAWLAALKRDHLTDDQRRLVRICNLHFVSGKLLI